MKTRDKLILSILAGLAAMVLYASPMWWGVVFAPARWYNRVRRKAEGSSLRAADQKGGSP